MKRVVFIVICILLFLTSCNLTPMDEGRGVNDYIFPYIEFTLSEDGTYYTAQVVDGAALSEIYIPSFDDYFGNNVPVLVFNGFENKKDAKNLEAITFESSQTTFSTDLFIYAENLKTFTVDNIDEEYSTYSELAVVEKPGYEWDGWYIKGTDVKRENGDRIIAGHTVLEPRWKDHNIVFVPETAPSCTKNGEEEHYFCTSCNKIYRDKTALEEIDSENIVIPASHTLVAVEEHAATCTSSGNIAYYICSSCSLRFKDEEGVNYLKEEDTIIKALGHSPVEMKAKAATCTEDGNIAYWLCQRCLLCFSDEACTQEVADVTEPKKGHNWVYTYGEKITDGHWLECTRCKETKDVTPHDYSIKEVIKKPTHDGAGTMRYTCRECGAVTDEDIKPVGDHVWVSESVVASTCEERGYTEYICSIEGCSASYKEYVDPLGHQMPLIEHAKVKETCTTDGTEAYWKCGRCGNLFSDSNAKNKIEKPAVIGKTGHSWTSWQNSTDGDYHERVCLLCHEIETQSHTYEEITKNRTPFKSRTCTEGAVYYKSCVCGKESADGFIDGVGTGHSEPVVHQREESNCTAHGHKTYYTCSNECCRGKYFLDKDLTEEVKWEDIELGLADHTFDKKQFRTTDESHIYICDACGKEIKTESHTKTWTYDYIMHHWECKTCGYKSEEEYHILTGDTVGKRICTFCGYSETESQNKKEGFDIEEIDLKPSGYLISQKKGTEWTFTLISTNDKYAEIESYMWFVNGEEVDGNESTYMLSAPGKHSYSVMCVFSANGCYASSSMTINGGNENE